METKYFSLGISENTRFEKIFRIIFGLVCLAIAIFWLIFNINSLKTDRTLWLTIIFIAAFGFYQIWAGLGRATMFIKFGSDYIHLKKNPILLTLKMSAEEIRKIELFPLNVIFFLKPKKKIVLRFGTTYHEINEKVKDEILGFAESNNIPFQIMQEEL